MVDLHVVVASAHVPLRRALASYLRSLPGVASVVAVDNMRTLADAIAFAIPDLLLLDDRPPDLRSPEGDRAVTHPAVDHDAGRREEADLLLDVDFTPELPREESDAWIARLRQMLPTAQIAILVNSIAQQYAYRATSDLNVVSKDNLSAELAKLLKTT